jgi:hypothetical protein
MQRQPVPCQKLSRHGTTCVSTASCTHQNLCMITWSQAPVSTSCGSNGRSSSHEHGLDTVHDFSQLSMSDRADLRRQMSLIHHQQLKRNKEKARQEVSVGAMRISWCKNEETANDFPPARSELPTHSGWLQISTRVRLTFPCVSAGPSHHTERGRLVQSRSTVPCGKEALHIELHTSAHSQ